MPQPAASLCLMVGSGLLELLLSSKPQSSPSQIRANKWHRSVLGPPNFFFLMLLRATCNFISIIYMCVCVCAVVVVVVVLNKWFFDWLEKVSQNSPTLLKVIWEITPGETYGLTLRGAGRDYANTSDLQTIFLTLF